MAGSWEELATVITPTGPRTNLAHRQCRCGVLAYCAKPGEKGGMPVVVTCQRCGSAIHDVKTEPITRTLTVWDRAGLSVDATTE